MKNVLRLSSVVVAFLCPLVIAGSASATVTWTATFEKNKSGDVCSSTAADAEFKPGINEKNGTRINAEVLGEQVYTGSLACKVTVHPDDTYGMYNQDRVDIHHLSTLTGEGKDSWVSGHYFMPADAMMRNEIGFYETESTSKNVIDFWVAPKTGGGTTLSFGVGFLGATVLWTGDFAIGKWHQMAVHVKWSQNANTGSVDFWLDGVQVVTAHKYQTKPDGNALFFQTGLHRILPMNFVDTIYFDDFIESDTQNEAKIAAPTQGGGATDGGTDAVGAGSAGAGGTGGASGAGGTTGAAGTTGTAGTGSSTGVAGSTGAAGTGSSGASSTTGAAGSGSSTGTAGTGSSTGTAGTTGTTSHAKSSGGCAYASASDGSYLGLASMLALFGTVIIKRRARR